MEYSDKRKLAIAGITFAVICGLVVGVVSGANWKLVREVKAAEDFIPTYVSYEANPAMNPTFEGLGLSIQGSLQKSADSFGSNIKKEQQRLEEVKLEEERKAKEEEERLAEEERQNQIAAAQSVTNTVQSQSYDVSGGVAGSFTLYGMDCYGCSGQYTGVGSTASGIRLDANQGVLQSNGQWLPGITYDGYYIVAAGGQYPIGTIIQISDHGFAGAGLVPGVPFLAIVGDRGGAIHGNRFDLYAGSERALQIYQNPGYGTVTIVG